MMMTIGVRLIGLVAMTPASDPTLVHGRARARLRGPMGGGPDLALPARIFSTLGGENGIPATVGQSMMMTAPIDRPLLMR